MQYLTGIHALNLNCDLLTCGDWHQSALKWEDLTLRNTDQSVFGDWGIERNKEIPNHTKRYPAANHIRALLDLIAEGNFAVAQGMKEDFICNDDYTSEVFNKVVALRDADNWDAIDAFMCKEYRLEWIKYKERAFR